MIDLTPFVGKMNDLDTHITPSPDFYENVAGKEAGKFYAEMCRKAIDEMSEDEKDSVPEIMGAELEGFWCCGRLHV